MSKSLIRKKLPKAPPKSPVRSIAQLSDADFKKFKDRVLKLTKPKGPMKVAGLFKNFNLFRETKGAKGIDPNKYYRDVEIAEQLLPMMEAEVKTRRKGKRAMRKKTVSKKSGKRIFAPKETGIPTPKPRPKKPKEPKKPNKKIFAPKETGTIQDLYDKGLIFDRDKKSKSKVNKKAGQRVGTANYPGKKKVQPTPEELKGMKKKTAKKKSGGTVGTHNRLY